MDQKESFHLKNPDGRSYLSRPWNHEMLENVAVLRLIRLHRWDVCRPVAESCGRVVVAIECARSGTLGSLRLETRMLVSS